MIALAAALCVSPRRRELYQLAALSRALIIGLELILRFWVYAYVDIHAGSAHRRPRRADARTRPRAGRAGAWPVNAADRRRFLLGSPRALMAVQILLSAECDGDSSMAPATSMRSGMSSLARRRVHAPTRLSAASARRAAFAALLASTLLVPHVSSSALTFPGVSHFVSLLPFLMLMLIPFVDRRGLRRLAGLDMLVLAATLIPLGFEQLPRQWPIIALYPILAVLALRALSVARVGRPSAVVSQPAPVQPLLPYSWLVAGIAVLAVVHAMWALGSHVTSDISLGSVKGASNIIHGHAIYATQRVGGGTDPHTDTYGPVNYEAYVPFVALAGSSLAARLTTLFFDLLTAALLFFIGTRTRGRSVGVLLAYCWLAFPLTLYEDALGFNDSIVAAAVVAVILASGLPRRGGVLTALAAWTKMSPLALLPLLAGQAGYQRRKPADLLRFVVGFGVASLLVFLPAFAHSSPATFVSRTFGFQSARPPADSLWSSLQLTYAANTPWLETAIKVAHGLLSAAVATFVLLLFRIPRRMDTVGLAATAAATMIAVELCLSYYSYSYILWFAPLLLVAFILRGDTTAANPPPRARAIVPER